MPDKFKRPSEVCFVHIPRTGGTSVIELMRSLDAMSILTSGPNFRTWAAPHGGTKLTLIGHNSRLPGYMTLAKYRSRHRRGRFAFAFVRNPYARVLSAFDHLNRSPLNAGDRADARKYLRKYGGDFEAFVLGALDRKNPAVLTQMHFRPQWEWICDQKGRMLADFVGRLENISRDLKALERRTRIGLMVRQLPHHHWLERPDYRHFYTERTRRIVAQAYRRDLTLFRYSF